MIGPPFGGSEVDLVDFAGAGVCPINVWKEASTAAAGSSNIWVPAAGKSWRLRRYMVQLTENATLAAAGILTITFTDAGAALPFVTDFYVPSAAVNGIGTEVVGPIDLGEQGILSAAPNNALIMFLSAALVTGQVRVTAMGTEQ